MASRMEDVSRNTEALAWQLDLEGRVVLAGGGLPEIGLEASTLFGHSMQEIVPDGPEAHDRVARALAGKTVHEITEWQGRVFRVIHLPLLTEAGEVTGVVGAAVDVSGTAHLIEDIARAEEEAAILLAGAIEARDSETGEHVARMSALCGDLAARAGSPHADLIRRASILHDVGKVAVPNGILFRERHLTLAEYEVVKTHAEIGHRLLSKGRSQVLRQAAVIALTHHERWDGSGYPNHLEGPETPFAGRIAAICDAFDAMTSDRPYRAAMPHEAALEELRRESGRQFDPDLLDAFVGGLEGKKDVT